MKLVRLKLFSGYDSELSGTSYLPAQVVTERVIIDPLGNIIDKIDSSSLRNIKPLHRNTKRVSSILKPLGYILTKDEKYITNPESLKEIEKKKKKSSKKKGKKK